MTSHFSRWLPPLIVSALVLATPATATDGTVVPHVFGDGVAFEATRDHGGSILSVSGPGEAVLEYRFGPGEPIHLSLHNELGAPLEDGSYTFELRFQPKLDAAAQAAMRQAREDGDRSLVDRLRNEGRIPTAAAPFSGSFTVAEGKILTPREEEESRGGAPTPALTPLAGPSTASGSGDGLSNISAADFLILDDLIVDGSACIGFSCVNGESFGADTLRFKETTLRLKFQDTSVGSYPSTDWQLVANDSALGGLNKFSIEDVTASRTPFTLEANAPDHSLYVDDSGRVGFGTSTPTVEGHFVDGDTATLRLQQDGSSSFTPQTWDIGGNEAGFFVRDVTGGSTFPFRIRPGADSSSLVVDGDSQVGVGILDPETAFHVKGSDGGTGMIVEEAGTTEAARVMAQLKNNGRILWTMQDTSPDGTTWRFRTVEGQFNFDSDLGTGNEFVLDSSGNLTILGMLTQNSNREAKNNIEPVDPQKVLQKVAELPIATWTYKKDQSVEHLGPMAQDFHAAFGLGTGNLGITTYDTAGVALASVQALYALAQDQEEALRIKEEELETLRREYRAAMKALVERIETLERGSDSAAGGR